MSWFEYGIPRKRSLRKGVWLRVRDLPQDLLNAAKPYLKRISHPKANFANIEYDINWVIVSEIRENNKVLLEFWCKDPIDRVDRYIVFHLLVDENPEWICEGDLGRGYKD